MKGGKTPSSDVDIALLLSEEPKTMKELLEYYLYLLNKLSNVFGDRVDSIILNLSPPLLKHQAIKHGKLIYSRSERARVEFEARSQREYLDFSLALAMYDECFMNVSCTNLYKQNFQTSRNSSNISQSTWRDGKINRSRPLTENVAAAHCASFPSVLAAFFKAVRAWRRS
ncbi:MAG: nucleotidyltransferase domain-containing protein [Candidatus Bathyarchaeia archaeon]